MSLKSFFFASMIIGVLLGYRQHFASANDDFAQYHYAYRLNEPRNQIILVDPSNPALPPQIKTLPVGTKLWTGRGSALNSPLAPSGEWLILHSFDATTNEKLFLFWHIATDELREIYRYPGRVNDIYYFAWSPDSKYLAFATIPYQSIATDREIVFIYAVDDGTLTFIYENFTGGYPVYDLVWSPDSQEISISLWDCPGNGCPGGATIFQIYTLPDGILRTSTILNHTTNLGIGRACGLKWSPDNRYIAFTYACSYDVGEYNYDIYVWDTLANQITQITHLTNDFVSSEASLIYLNSYNYIWLTGDRLLISYHQAQGMFAFNPAKFESKTIIYTVSQQTTSVVLNNSLGGLTPNPSTNSLAFFESIFWLDAENAFQQQHNEVHIAHIEDQTLVNDFTAPIGCGFRWSPDGSILAYNTLINPGNANLFCNPTTGFAFVDTTNNTIHNFNFGSELRVETLGWVKLF